MKYPGFSLECVLQIQHCIDQKEIPESGEVSEADILFFYDASFEKITTFRAIE